MEYAKKSRYYVRLLILWNPYVMPQSCWPSCQQTSADATRQVEWGGQEKYRFEGFFVMVI